MITCSHVPSLSFILTLIYSYYKIIINIINHIIVEHVLALSGKLVP